MEPATGYSEAFGASFLTGAITFYIYSQVYLQLGMVVGLTTSVAIFALLTTRKVYSVRKVIWLTLSSVFWVSFIAMILWNGVDGIIQFDRSYNGVPLIPTGPVTKGITTKMEPFHFPQANLPGTFSNDYIGGKITWPFDLTTFVVLAFTPWLTTAILFGRGFCGWVCWFGGLVEGFASGRRQRWAMTKFREEGPKFLTGLNWWTRSLKWLLFILTLILSVIFWVQPLNTIQWSGPIGWFAYTPNIVTVTIIFLLFFIILPRMTKKKWFCLFCPVGVGFNLFGRISPFEVKIDTSKCTHCNLCIPVCPTYTLSSKSLEKGKPDPHCDLCTKCMQACPERVIDIVYRGSFKPARPWFIPTVVTAAVLWYGWFIYTVIQLVPRLLKF